MKNFARFRFLGLWSAEKLFPSQLERTCRYVENELLSSMVENCFTKQFWCSSGPHNIFLFLLFCTFQCPWLGPNHYICKFIYFHMIQFNSVIVNFHIGEACGQSIPYNNLDNPPLLS